MVVEKLRLVAKLESCFNDTEEVLGLFRKRKKILFFANFLRFIKKTTYEYNFWRFNSSELRLASKRCFSANANLLYRVFRSVSVSKSCGRL